MRFWLIPPLILAGCDVAPRPIDFERSFVETPEEGYQVFIDGLVAEVIAEKVAEGCPDAELNNEAQEAYQRWVFTELVRLAEQDPDIFDAIMRRIGVPLNAREVMAGDLHRAEAMIADLSTKNYLLGNLGVATEIVSRATGVVIRLGLEPDCTDAEREIAEGTLAGSFLKIVDPKDSGGLTVTAAGPDVRVPPGETP